MGVESGMRKLLLLAMAVVTLSVGCQKMVNPPLPPCPTDEEVERAWGIYQQIKQDWDETSRILSASEYPLLRKNSRDKMDEAFKSWNVLQKENKAAMDVWYDSLWDCLHCGSDLAKQGAEVCSKCGRDQRKKKQ